MKLAEALLQRAEYTAVIGSLQSRIINNMKVQEGESPFENPGELFGEFNEITDKMNALICKINACNYNVVLPDGRRLSEALTERDSLLKKRNMLSMMAAAIANPERRMTRSEIKIQPTMNVSELQKKIDVLSRQFRELDTKIQEINWLTEFE